MMNPSNLPANTPEQPSSAAPEIVAAEPALSLLEILLRNKAKLMVCVAVAMFIGVIYQLVAERTYQSSAEIFVQPSDSNHPQSPLAPGGLSSGLPSTHARLIESMPVLLTALEAPEVTQSATIAKLKTPSQRLKYLQKNLSVDFSKESEVVGVSLKGGVPQDTKTILDAVLAAYLAQLQIEVGESGAGEPAAATRGVMQDEMIASRLMMLTDELTAAEVELEAAEVRVGEAKLARGNLARLSTLLDETGMNPQSHGLAEITYLKAELARLDQQIEGMPSAWGPSHKVRGPVQRQADALRYEITNLTKNAQKTMVGLLVANHKNAADRVSELSGRIGDHQNQASVVAQLPVDIYQKPFVPQQKIAPMGAKTMGMALFLGLAAGLVLTLVSELKRPPAAVAASSPRVEVQDTTGTSTRALPRLMSGEDVSRGEADGESESSAMPMLGMVPEVAAGRLTSPKFDATASSIHQIRAVLQVQAHSQGTRAFAFTSPRRGAGKTSVAIGVASSLAMSGTRTLVVDCDLAGRISRRQNGKPASPTGKSGSIAFDVPPAIDEEGSSSENPSLDNIVIEQGYVSEEDTRTMAAKNAPIQMGITGVLDGAPLQECVVKATVQGLSLLPAVNAQTHHIGKMSDSFIQSVIDQAEGHYDLVLFDTGPIPGSVEALLVTSQTDGVIVVVPQGETRQALDRTMSYLKVVGAKITGTVFNRVANATDKAPSDPSHMSVGGAVAAAAAGVSLKPPAASSQASPATPPSPQDQMLVELEREQAATDDDGNYVSGDAALGSGILAAAVFSDADSEYESNSWTLEETSDGFNGSVDELFGKVTGQNNDAPAPNKNGQA